jgi:hypothetical protein
MTAAPPSPLRLTAILVAAPVAWAALTGLAWALVPLACREQVGFTLHVATGAAFLVTAAGAAAAVGLVRRSAGRAADDPLRFLEQLGAMVGALLALGLLFAWSFVVFLDPCLTH